MENASKALIIAGAILLAILLITLGILVYNQAAGVINNNAMSDVEMQQFNQKFTQYEGKQRGVTVRSLLQTVLSNNTSADNDDRKVSVDGNAGISMTIEDTSAPTSDVETGETYDISFNYGESGGNAGLVTEIIINTWEE